MSDDVTCPSCGGPAWSNKAAKAAGRMKPNAPDAACKDKEGCGWKLWPEKKAKAPEKAPETSYKPVWTWKGLANAYHMAQEIVAAYAPSGWPPEVRGAQVSTLMIQAERLGLPVPPDVDFPKPKKEVEDDGDWS